MKTLTLLLFVLASLCAYGQATKTGTGNWNDATKWASGNIGDVVTENVTVSQNVTSTVLNGESYTIGNLVLNQNDKLYVNAGGTLNVGDATHPATLTTDQNNELYIDGNFTVWGNVTIPQNIVIKIKGTFTIKGNLTMNQNANIELSSGAKLIIGGGFTAAQNTNVNITGTGQVLVSSNVNVGHGSNLNTPAGGFQYGGTCTDGGNNFCKNATGNPALPIKLLYFKSEDTGEQTRLYWATATEENFDHFDVEIADKDLQFHKIGEIAGHGNSSIIQNYELFVNKTYERAYYRLKSVDYDGSIDYSNVIAVDGDSKKKFEVYPNPANSGGDLNFVINFNAEVDDKITITDQMGHVRFVGNPASNELNPQLSTGLYVVSYTSRTYHTTLKIVVK